jgi:hypothetical protein
MHPSSRRRRSIGAGSVFRLVQTRPVSDAPWTLLCHIRNQWIGFRSEETYPFTQATCTTGLKVIALGLLRSLYHWIPFVIKTLYFIMDSNDAAMRCPSFFGGRPKNQNASKTTAAAFDVHDKAVLENHHNAIRLAPLPTIHTPTVQHKK